MGDGRTLPDGPDAPDGPDGLEADAAPPHDADDIPTLTQIVARPRSRPVNGTASGEDTSRDPREPLTQRVLERAWLLLDSHFSEQLATQLRAELDARLTAQLDEAIRAATPAIAAQVAGHLRATIEPLLAELVARALAEELGETAAGSLTDQHRQI
jgi:hypothetical protein